MREALTQVDQAGPDILAKTAPVGVPHRLDDAELEIERREIELLLVSPELEDPDLVPEAAAGHDLDMARHVRLRPGVGLAAIEAVVLTEDVLALGRHDVHIEFVDLDAERHVLAARLEAPLRQVDVQLVVDLLQGLAGVGAQGHEDVHVGPAVVGRALGERPARRDVHQLLARPFPQDGEEVRAAEVEGSEEPVRWCLAGKNVSEVLVWGNH